MVCGLKQVLKRVTNRLRCLKKKEIITCDLIILKFAYFVYCSLLILEVDRLIFAFRKQYQNKTESKKDNCMSFFLRSFLSCCCMLLQVATSAAVFTHVKTVVETRTLF